MRSCPQLHLVRVLLLLPVEPACGRCLVVSLMAAHALSATIDLGGHGTSHLYRWLMAVCNIVARGAVSMFGLQRECVCFIIVSNEGGL